MIAITYKQFYLSDFCYVGCRSPLKLNLASITIS